MTNFDLKQEITTQLGTMTIRDTIEYLGYTPDDFKGFDSSMIVAYVNSLYGTSKDKKC